MANFNSHGQPLDGTGNIKPTPFDAHEQVVRGPHTFSPEDGYQPATTVNGQPLAEGQSVADVLEQDGE